MFDIGFPELLLVAVIGLLVLGPERLPEALRTLGLWLGRMRRSFSTVKAEIEKEIGMDDIRRQLHNEAVMEEMKRIEDEVRGLDPTGSAADTRQSAPTDTAGASTQADATGNEDRTTPDPVQSAAASADGRAAPEAGKPARGGSDATTEPATSRTAAMTQGADSQNVQSKANDG